jgi:hypothetical protein
MYIESKAAGLTGEARIGRVTFSKSGRSIYYQGEAFRSLKGRDYKASNFKSRLGRTIGSPVREGTEGTGSMTKQSPL